MVGMNEQQTTDRLGHPGTQPTFPFPHLLLGSGLVGLLLNGLLAALATWLVAGGHLPALLPQPLVALLLGVVFGGFSLAEIPVMILTLRHLLTSQPGRRAFALGLNALFVFFAVVYALPLLLLSGRLAWGWILCGLGLVRLIASLIFVHEPAPKTTPGS
jgi:hypothetical protein